MFCVLKGTAKGWVKIEGRGWLYVTNARLQSDLTQATLTIWPIKSVVKFEDQKNMVSIKWRLSYCANCSLKYTTSDDQQIPQLCCVLRTNSTKFAHLQWINKRETRPLCRDLRKYASVTVALTSLRGTSAVRSSWLRDVCPSVRKSLHSLNNLVYRA